MDDRDYYGNKRLELYVMSRGVLGVCLYAHDARYAAVGMPCVTVPGSCCRCCLRIYSRGSTRRFRRAPPTSCPERLVQAPMMWLRQT